MIEILKFKLDKAGTGTVTYRETVESDDGSVINLHTVESGHVVHSDLRKVMDQLAIHIAGITEQAKVTRNTFGQDLVELGAPFSNLKCTGFSIGGEDETAGVTLIGRRTLKSGKVLNLITPFEMFESDQENSYRFGSELSGTIHTVIQEIHMYIEGKYEPSNQIDMFEDPATEETQDEEPLLEKVV